MQPNNMQPKPEKQFKKSSNYEFDRRVVIVMKFIRDGLRAEQMLQKTTTPVLRSPDPLRIKKHEELVAKMKADGLEWNISERQMYHYISAANARFKALSDVDVELMRSLNMQRLEELYNKSLLMQDFKTALAVVKELNVFHGLTIQKVETKDITLENEILKKLQAAGDEGVDALFKNLQEETMGCGKKKPKPRKRGKGK